MKSILLLIVACAATLLPAATPDESWQAFCAREKIRTEQLIDASRLLGGTAAENSSQAQAMPGQLYLIGLHQGGHATLDLKDAPGHYLLSWFNEHTGDFTKVGEVTGGAPVTLTAPSPGDWIALLRGYEPVTWREGKHVLLVGGGSSHDFERYFNRTDVATLGSAGGLSPVYTADLGTALQALPAADVLVLSTNQKEFGAASWRAALVRHLAAGRGLILLHPGTWRSQPDWPEFETTIAGALANAHPKLAPFEVTVTSPAHPIMQGIPAQFTVTDELYQVTVRPGAIPIEMLAQTGVSPGDQERHPSVWVAKHPTARVVGLALGHDERTHDSPEYQRILIQAVRWAAP